MKLFIFILYLIWISPVFGQDTPGEKLEVFTPFIGTWKAEFANGTHDVTNYEWILGGKALRIMHSISEGAYGGEALIHWNNEKEAITYRYVTTSTFYTEGTITPTENGFDAHEVVHGNMDGISETRAGYKIKDGEMHVWSQFLKDGEWAEKTRTTYIKAPGAEVRFKSLIESDQEPRLCICMTDYTTFALEFDPGSDLQTVKKQMVGHISVGNILMQEWGNFACKCTDMGVLTFVLWGS